MTEILSKLKLDTWYGIVLYLGSLAIAASLFLTIGFLENKHLFGFGLGMILIGLSFFIAEKTLTSIKPPNVYTGPAAWITQKEIRHNPITALLLIIGTGLVSVFGFFIIKSLI